MNNFILLVFLIVIFLWYLYKFNIENYMETEPTISRLKNLLLPHFPELKKVKLMKDNASYTINKSKIYICTESDGKIYDDNMLIFVILHELAHTMCKSIGHGDEFQTIFKELLMRAENVGIYDPSLPRVENYCNTKR